MPVRMIGKLARLAMPPADYTDAARDGEGDGNLMGKRRSQHPQQLQDNIFAGNLFFDDLLACGIRLRASNLLSSPTPLRCSSTPGNANFIWSDAERLDIVQSVARIHQQYPDMCRDWIEEYLLDWIEMDYAPEHYSKAQLDELDRL